MTHKTRILVTGSQGQLGRALQSIATDYPDAQFTFASRQQLDISTDASCEDFFQHHQFDVIINCAAYTAVDKAEREQELAEQVNHYALTRLGRYAVRQHAKLIHISTDYVFNGKHYRPYVEADPVDPQGVYGKSKLAGEQALRTEMPNNALIIRTSWLYSEFGQNFMHTMLRLAPVHDRLTVVFDQVGTPTYAIDLAEAIMAILDSPHWQQSQFDTAVYHYSNEGVCSWFDFAKAIFDMQSLHCQLIPIESKDFPTPAARPHYSVLNKAKIKQDFDLIIPHWQDSLRQCLHELRTQPA